MPDDALVVGAQGGAVIGRHEHHHRGTRRRRLARARRGDLGAEMARRDDDRHAGLDVRQAEIEQRVALGVGQQELLGVVGEDADAVDALIDHAVEHAALAVEVELALGRERRGGDGKDAGGRRAGSGHGRSSVVALVVALGAFV